MTKGRARAADRPRPIVLVVLDGFGIGDGGPGDAIAAAPMPTWRGLLARWPHSRLRASEDAVGLPPGQMGNSEVGHLNLGAGRAVLQDLPRIDAAIDDGTFFTRPALLSAGAQAREPGRALDVVSLIGPGGVHANDRHLVALTELALAEGVATVRIHALLDGRDTPPSSGLGYVLDLEARLTAVHPGAGIATVGGRYYAMDRDRRWERVETGYDAIVHAEAPNHAATAAAAIEAAYARGETDEFVSPTVIDGRATALTAGDPIVIANFRADRARQLTHALADGPAFDGFDRTSPSGRAAPDDLVVVTMTEYEEGLGVQVAFPPETARSLAQAMSEAGWHQFHVAETEKYAHVTYFFNGGVESPWPGEERRLVASQRVATYDLAPEMSAAGVTDALLAAIDSGAYDFIVANYANPDMVGHTGVWDATIDALAVIDASLARVVDAVERVESADPGGPGAILAITADHGNADDLRDAAGLPVTAHSLNPVPFMLLGRSVAHRRLLDGVLADVAPTLLELAGLPGWPAIAGHSLLAPVEAPGPSSERPGDRA
ncbi:MAG TPA: 2,3-bisphosphoglycerate-independent phosphoglycerate mutase [Methylomirabilota bacterium]|nr:2,3-bisphosphoglycerate-independent phosphoglycerate mutase [Methylomirabilota bacterium]